MIFYILYSLVWLLSLLPLGLARAMGRLLGRLFQRLDKKHRRIVRDNLAPSFPDKDKAWVERTTRGVFEHIGMVAMEVPYLIRLKPETLMKRVRVHGREHIDRLIEQGSGFLILTGHIGNWEWSGIMLGLIGVPAAVVARPLDFAPAEKLVTCWRSKSGNAIIPKLRSARALLRVLKNQGVAALLLDQNVDWYDGEWVDFFGRPACSNKGMALLARAYDAPVIPAYLHRAPDGKFDLRIEPPIPVVKTSDKTKDVWQNTQNYTKALENAIRRYPEQWFWLHQRWKTKPYQDWPRK
jgi:KDO2-lipid IV(A) lauroyltransferase